MRVHRGSINNDHKTEEDNRLIVLNHSPRFWVLVEGVLPDYRERRRWLRENGHRLAL